MKSLIVWLKKDPDIRWGEVGIALIRLAEDGSVRSPELLNTAGHWWVRAARGEQPAGEALRHHDMCPHHPANDRVTCREGSDCAGTPPPTPEETAAGIALARAALAQAPQYAPRIKPTPTQTEDHHARMQALRAELEETQCPPST